METKSIVLGIALLATTTVNAQNLTLKANNIDKIVAVIGVVLNLVLPRTKKAETEE